jgi:hypothetical protein
MNEERVVTIAKLRLSAELLSAGNEIVGARCNVPQNGPVIKGTCNVPLRGMGVPPMMHGRDGRATIIW